MPGRDHPALGDHAALGLDGGQGCGLGGGAGLGWGAAGREADEGEAQEAADEYLAHIHGLLLYQILLFSPARWPASLAIWPVE